jgi:hypothetical protein
MFQTYSIICIFHHIFHQYFTKPFGIGLESGSVVQQEYGSDFVGIPGIPSSRLGTMQALRPALSSVSHANFAALVVASLCTCESLAVKTS